MLNTCVRAMSTAVIGYNFHLALGHVHEKGIILSYISALDGIGIHHFLKNRED